MDQAEIQEIQAMDDPNAKIDKLVTLLAASQETIVNLQGQVGNLSQAAARPEAQG